MNRRLVIDMMKQAIFDNDRRLIILFVILLSNGQINFELFFNIKKAFIDFFEKERERGKFVI